MFLVVNYNEENGINVFGSYINHKDAVKAIADEVYSEYDIDIDMNDYPFNHSCKVYEYDSELAGDRQYADVGIDECDNTFIVVFDSKYGENQQWLIIETK